MVTSEGRQLANLARSLKAKFLQLPDVRQQRLI